MERGHTETPPDFVLQRAFALFGSRAPQPTLLERIIATLVFDSRQNLMPAMARSSTGVSFNLVYSVSYTNIYLSCEYDGLRWQVAGQMESADPFPAIIARGGGEPVQADIDEDGEFRLPALLSGQYDLVIPGATQEVVLPTINLAPS